jgi:hypothetical protein
VTQPVLDLNLPDPPLRKARRAPSAKVVWSRYKVLAPVHCDDCVLEVHEQWPHDTHAPNRATWRRKAGDLVTYACNEHALSQKIRDGVNDTRKRK